MNHSISANPPIVQAASRAAVLMPALVPEPFDYLVPAGTPEGALVEATLAGRKLVGAVWQAAANAKTIPLAKLKPITRVLDSVPPLAPAYRQWLDWISDFTLAPKGAVLSLCGLAHAAKPPKKPYTAKPFTITLPTLTEAQQQVADALCAFVTPSSSAVTPPHDVAPLTTYDARLTTPKPILLDGVTGSGKTEVYFHAIAAALGKGESRVERRESSGSLPLAGRAREGGVPQASSASGATSPHLTSPITGEESSSLDSRRSTLATPSPQILVLLPEIALTHQWLARFEKTFGAAPLFWHSRMTPAQKARAWIAIANGEAQVVVGARSALFLPFANLTLIIVDEEHDPSYKQEDGVLYHARDMAVVRARFERVPILLASATPALETLENVREGKYTALHLPERFGAAGLPQVRLVDLRIDAPERGEFLSPTVKQALLETLARGEQALFFLNRRGYAPLLLCRGCGHRFECKNCSAWLTVHGRKESRVESRESSEGKNQQETKAKQRHVFSTRLSTLDPRLSSLSCHHCGHKEPMPATCPSCNAEREKLAACGPGVERIAEEVRGMFVEGESRVESRESSDSLPLAGRAREGGVPQASSASDSPPPHLTSPARGEESYSLDSRLSTLDSPPPTLAILSSDEAIAADTWAEIEAGNIDILVGTQMVAKGHHFPRLTLVVVVDADVGLSGADLRAGERTYQLLHQLGGRAGRGELAGTVLVQTYEPEHPVMQSLAAHDRARLMALEAKERKAGGWPPFGQLAAILLDGTDEAKVRAASQLLARSAPDDARLTVLGPAPAPLSKLRGQFRYRLLVKAKPGIHLQRTLRAWLDGQKFSGVRIKVDVNPYYFL